MTAPSPPDLALSLAAVRAAIAQAARQAGRDAQSVTLVAVSKQVEAARVAQALALGQRHFGENRVQESAAKWPDLRAQWPDATLHLVGQLQSNKAEEAVALFDVIHSVDRPGLVKALAVAMDRRGRRPDCFIQVNIGAEGQKGGCAIESLPDLIEAAHRAGLPVVGLMAVPPAEAEPTPYFALLARLARRHGLLRLSMGMSGDLAQAIAMGATDVRVGTAIFGARAALAPPAAEHVEPTR